MYRQISISVQLLKGKTRMCSPLVEPAVIEAPQLGPLMARVPLAEGIAERENALFRARFLFVAPRAADAGVETEFGDRIEQASRPASRCGSGRRS